MKRKLAVIVGLLVACACSIRAAEQRPELSESFAVAPGVEGGLPQYYPEVAWAPESKVWLVVWEDGLTTGDETAREGRAKDIFAARISADGKVLDPGGIPVCTAKNFQGRPCVASDGKGFLVVWHDMRNGKDHDLYAARVSADGKVLDADGFLVSGEAHNQVFPDVVYGGGNYYAAWLDARHFPPEYRVYGARISAGGKVLDAKGNELIRLLTDEQVAGWAKAPFGGSNAVKVGWIQYSKQPGPPSLATNGSTHVVMTNINAMLVDFLGRVPDHLIQQVDAATGRVRGAMQTFCLKGTIRYGAWGKENLPRELGVTARGGRPRIASQGEKGFLAGISSYYPIGWGARGDVFWTAVPLGGDGKTIPDEGKRFPRFQFVYGDDKQQQYGSRGQGIRANRLSLAWDGKRALYVIDRYRHLGEEGKGDYTGDSDIMGIFVNEEGKRLADLATGQAVESDPLDPAKVKGGAFFYAAAPKVTPFALASGEALQANPAAAAGEEGSFLVVWQEETLEKDARITGRLVKVK